MAVNPIVQVNVSQTQAPAPSTLQRTGAIISQGGTNRAANTLTLLTQLSDLTPILSAAKPIASLSWNANVVTITTSAPHGWTTGETIPIIVSGASPVAYNGSVNGTVTGTTTITYPLVGNPGAATVTGTVLLGDEAELLSQVTTFFAQGAALGVYVLELGEGNVADGVTALTTWLTNNSNTVYAFLVPAEWDNNSGFITLANAFTALNSKTYFFVTTTSGNYTAYAGIKSIMWLIPAPGAPSTEFSMAALFHAALNYNPSSSNRVTPLAFTYTFSTTAYPTAANQTLLTAILASNGNYIGTGAEGGITNTIVRNGHTADGKPWVYWYSIDWDQINLDLDLSNAVINGSNNPLNPLLYNQAGINVLQSKAAQTLGRSITYGLTNGTLLMTGLPTTDFINNFNAGLYKGKVVVNAEPYSSYVANNPNDYAIGKYAGLSAVVTPQLGFEQIVFNLNATTFAS